MSFDLPPIVKLAERVMIDVEQCVHTFQRRYRYTVGARLSAHAFTVADLSHLAWRDRNRQLERTNDLVRAIDRLKLCLQLAKQLHAFKSFAQFEALARTVHELGKQCGGWQKRQHQKGQNEQTSSAQRATILSARGASNEANQ